MLEGKFLSRLQGRMKVTTCCEPTAPEWTEEMWRRFNSHHHHHHPAADAPWQGSAEGAGTRLTSEEQRNHDNKNKWFDRLWLGASASTCFSSDCGSGRQLMSRGRKFLKEKQLVDLWSPGENIGDMTGIKPCWGSASLGFSPAGLDTYWIQEAGFKL